MHGGAHRGPRARRGLVDPGVRGEGPGSLLYGELEATAAFVFAESLPRGVELGANDAMSYAEWLRRQHDAG